MSVSKEDFDTISERVIDIMSKLETISLMTNHFHENMVKLESYFKEREMETRESLAELRKRTHELRNDMFSIPLNLEKNFSDKISILSDKILYIEKEQEKAKSIQAGKSHVTSNAFKILVFVVPILFSGIIYIYNAIEIMKEEIKAEIDFEHDKHTKEHA